MSIKNDPDEIRSRMGTAAAAASEAFVAMASIARVLNGAFRSLSDSVTEFNAQIGQQWPHSSPDKRKGRR